MTRLRSLFLLTCAAFASLVGPAASAAVLTPMAVTASSSFPFNDIYRPERLIDGSGLANGLHDGDFNSMFLTALEDQQARLVFDLGDRYALTGANLWNYNFGSPGFFSTLRRGVRDFTISLSDDGARFKQAFAGSLAQGTGAPIAAETFAFAGYGRYVALDILSNHASLDFDANDTGSGLSEVRFAGGAVPEPATWAMMIGGIGLTGGLLRARRRHAAPVIA